MSLDKSHHIALTRRLLNGHKFRVRKAHLESKALNPKYKPNFKARKIRLGLKASKIDLMFSD